MGVSVNEVDTMEPLKCGPCKRCVKRALDMKSSLLMSRMNVKEGDLCQPWEGSDCKGISDMCQVTHVTESMGPNNNGRGLNSKSLMTCKGMEIATLLKAW